MSEWTIEVDEPVTVEDWQNVAEGFFALSRETAKRAEAAEAEVERLTAALAERDRRIAELSALRHDSGEYPWHCAVCEAFHRLALRGES
jgi:hypothetical protein